MDQVLSVVERTLESIRRDSTSFSTPTRRNRTAQKLDLLNELIQSVRVIHEFQECASRDRAKFESNRHQRLIESLSHSQTFHQRVQEYTLTHGIDYAQAHSRITGTR